MTNLSETIPPLDRLSSFTVAVIPAVSPSAVAIPACAGAAAAGAVPALVAVVALVVAAGGCAATATESVVADAAVEDAVSFFAHAARETRMRTRAARRKLFMAFSCAD